MIPFVFHLPWLLSVSILCTADWNLCLYFPELYQFMEFRRTTHVHNGTAVAQWLRCCATNRKVAGSIPAGVNGFFIDIKSFRSHYGPGVDPASNRNEYQDYFLGVKIGRCVRLTTLPPSCAVVTKSGSLNFLETSGPLQACNGTALPLPLHTFIKHPQQPTCITVS